MNVLLIGPANSGKGSLSTLLKKHFAVTHMSSGDLLKEKIKDGSPEAKIIKNCIDAGKLVPTDIVNAACIEVISKMEGHTLLDGFPRTYEQAQFCMEKLKPQNIVVIEIVAPRELCIERSKIRRICKYCKAPQIVNETGICKECGKEDALEIRPDDAKIEIRLDDYEINTGDVPVYFKIQGVPVLKVYAQEDIVAFGPKVINFLKPYLA